MEIRSYCWNGSNWEWDGCAWDADTFSTDGDFSAYGEGELIALEGDGVRAEGVVYSGRFQALEANGGG